MRTARVHGTDDAATVLRHQAESSRQHAADQRRYYAEWARDCAAAPLFVAPPAEDPQWIVLHHETMAEGFARLALGDDLAVVQDAARAAMADVPLAVMESGEVCSRAEWCAEMLGNVFRRIVRDHGPVAEQEAVA